MVMTRVEQPPYGSFIHKKMKKIDAEAMDRMWRNSGSRNTDGEIQSQEEFMHTRYGRK